MGEIADMILDGTLDEVTGEYLGKPIGHPRSLHPDHYSNSPNAKSQYFGVCKGLHKQKSFEFLDDKVSATNSIIIRYGQEVLKSKMNKPMKIALEIQKDFHSFTRWFKNNNL